MEEKQWPESEKDDEKEKVSGRLISKVNIKSLEIEATKADNNEAYQMLAQGNNFRLGLLLSLSDKDEQNFIIEFMFCVLKFHSEVEKKTLERALNVSDILIKSGYTLFHQNDGWIICEKKLEPYEIRDEIEFMMNLVKEFQKIWNDNENKGRKIFVE